MKQRKSLRLLNYDYSQSGAYFITICCRDKQPVFKLQKYAAATWTYLSSHFQCNGGDISAAVILTNHIHLIVEFSEGNTKALGEKVREIKIAIWQTIRDVGWSGERLWQRNYYDHVIRNREDWTEKANYMQNNPVKAGLVEDEERWEYWWSVGLDKSAPTRL